MNELPVGNTSGQPGQPTTPERRTWLSRHGKWFLPTLAVVMMLMCFGGMVLGLLDPFGRVRGTDVYEQTLRLVREDPRVVEALGEPIEPGWAISGHVTRQNAAGNAEAVFNIAGPRGDAAVHARADYVDDAWRIIFLHVYIDEGDTQRDIAIVDEESG